MIGITILVGTFGPHYVGFTRRTHIGFLFPNPKHNSHRKLSTFLHFQKNGDQNISPQ